MTMNELERLRTSGSSPFRPSQFLLRVAAVASLIAVLILGLSAVAHRQPQRDAGPERSIGHDDEHRLAANELFVERADPVIIEAAEPSGGIAGQCPQQTVAYTQHQFTSGPFVAKAGFVETEIAAVSYTIDPSHFPIRIDRVDGLFGTENPQAQITTHWSLLVWQGDPNTGTLVYEINSDGTNPPHMVLSPPNNGIYLQAMVDPGDPEQIIVPNDGSNKFSVGFRIDQHNIPATATCVCVPGCPQCGILPAVCCPPNPGFNIFPTTDTNGLSQPSRNWVWARDCPGATGFCSPIGGWITLGNAKVSGDWIIRALYSPSGCAPLTGACCRPTLPCLDGLTQQECAAQGGTYQGDQTTCGSITCPEPTSTCCLPNGTCIASQTQTQCAAQGGTLLATPMICQTQTCRGACCVPSTGNCVFTTQNNCAAANGIFQGFGVACGNIVCFPVGGCCLPDGTCVDNQSPEECSAQGGTFQGHQVACNGVKCPVPEGACCLGTSCLSQLTQEDCEIGFGGTWVGPGTQCGAGTCEAQPCPGNTNGDGAVDVGDLLAVINGWGPCPPPPAACPADVAPPPNGDDQVNVSDLLAVINGWGPCP